MQIESIRKQHEHKGSKHIYIYKSCKLFESPKTGREPKKEKKKKEKRAGN